jgi:hypothetical protein
MDRMNREQFFAKLAPLGDEQLRKALWNLYWRGTAAARARIEIELTPGAALPRVRTVPGAVDAEAVSDEISEFVSLARSGAYIGGDRRVSPKARTVWRFTFRRLMAESRDALRADDIGPGAAAVEALIDLQGSTERDLAGQRPRRDAASSRRLGALRG